MAALSDTLLVACTALAMASTLPTTLQKAAAQSRTPEPGFRVIAEERGILVTVRDEPGRPVPTFRGQGEIKGSVLQLLAVMLDDARASEWAEGADETALLRVLDSRTNLVYSRSHQPWPVHDRDLVMKRSVEVLRQGAEFRLHLRCVAGEKPEVPGVVRVPFCDTTLLLREVDPNTTYVDYQVSVDPGGSIPDWLVRRASRNIPLHTLIALEKQAEKTKHQYDEVKALWTDVEAPL